MSTLESLAWFASIALLSAYFYSMGKAAGKKTPKPELRPAPEIQPYVSWRVVMDEYGIPDRVSMDINPETEKLLANSKWVEL